ncbi:hypothetical protein MKQ68_19250 [Chitinophaga horti]|uniref:DUF835 domain-containing protein n=1 Tax=Chitinophaga horti TaxID=2920382 RepID=A0ABY6IXV6_9BACT|nr:hypothetical protein [Chitinophaga horti]UYQ92226.1 hypothetical protein MKQ68_19250 [Chitinophaga horti]
MLFSLKGQQSGDVCIPAFTLTDGEIAVIRVPGGAKQQEAREACLKAILPATDSAVTTDAPFLYVDAPQQSLVGRLFNPVTVKDYIRKHASVANSIAQTVYETGDIYSNDKLSALTPTGRKLVALYTSLSWSNRIIVDLEGLDSQGARQVYNVVKQYAAIGGAAILLDYSDELQKDATAFIRIEIKAMLTA